MIINRSILARVSALAIVVGLLTSFAQANPARFRGGALVPSIDAAGVLTITGITFWEAQDDLDDGDDPAVGPPAPGASIDVRPYIILQGDPDDGQYGAVVFAMPYDLTPADDDSDARFVKRVTTHSINLNTEPGLAGLDPGDLIKVFWGSSYQDAGPIFNDGDDGSFDDEIDNLNPSIGPTFPLGILNYGNINFMLNSEIQWPTSGGNVDPIVFNFQGVALEVSRGTPFSTSLGATSTQQGVTLTYDGNAVPPPSEPAPGLILNPVTGVYTAPSGAGGTTDWGSNGNDPSADYFFGGNILANNGSLAKVEFIGLFDAVGASPNLVPTVNDGSRVFTVGEDMLAFVFTGTDDGLPFPPGELEWSVTAQVAGQSLPFSTSLAWDPITQTVTWTNTADVLPGLYIVSVTASDQEFNDGGNLFITVQELQIEVAAMPEPAMLGLMGLGGLALLRRRRVA